MKLAPTNKVCFPNQSQTKEQARIQTVMLALVSFLLGVAITAFWLHFTPDRNGVISSVLTNSEPEVGQPAMRIATANPPTRQLVASHPPVDAATIAEVKQAVPDYASVSVDDGTQILRAAALKQFTVTTKEMDLQVKQAQQQLSEAEKSQSPAAEEAARKHLQQTQAEGTEKLQQIAAQLQSQIAALNQLKGVAQ
jgi:hypothetical protein